MKVIGIVGSPRKEGNTEIFMKEAMLGAKENGATTELLAIQGLNINPCQGCLSCKSIGSCCLDDDMSEVYVKMLSSDGIIFGTPVYMWSMTGQAKVLLDRTYAIQRKFVNKVGGVISVATRQGSSTTINVFTHYFISNNMLIAGYVDTLAKEKGTATNDIRGMKACFELGKKMALMIKQQYKFPEKYDLPFSALVAEKYGITDPYPRK